MTRDDKLGIDVKRSGLTEHSFLSSGDYAENTFDRHRASINILPDDVILAVLLLFDEVQTLDSLTRVWSRARTISSAYEHQILASIIDRQLGLPVAQYAAACVDGPSARNKRNIKPVLRDYFKALFRPPPPERAHLKDWTLPQLQSTARGIRGHHKSVEVCLEAFLTHCRNKWPGRAAPNLNRASLSMVEERRLLRAIYLYQLYCHCFASTEASDEFDSSYIEVRPEDQAIFFLANLPPWVVEEVYTIHEFVFATYNDMITEADLCVENCLKRGSPTMPPADSCDNCDGDKSSLQADYIEDCVSLGVNYLAKMIAGRASGQSLHSLLSRSMHSTEPSSLGSAAQHWSIVLYTERDPSWVTHCGESLNTPNKTWSFIYRHSDDYNEYLFEIELASHRSFGAIFWDAPRVHELSKHFLKLLTAQY